MTETNFVAPPFSYSLGGNFDPNQVDQERVVLMGFIPDRSGSTVKYENEFNQVLQEFLREEQTSHIAEELFFQIVSFGTKVTIDSGWQPVVGFDTTKRLFKNSSDLTAGYDAVRIGIESMLDYGRQLEKAGTDVRYNLVLVTDGDFNEGSDRDGSTVRPLLDNIRNDERLYGKFTVTMYGVGRRDLFEETCDKLSFDRSALLTTGATGKDFKTMMKCVSQSISKSSSGQAVPNF